MRIGSLSDDGVLTDGEGVDDTLPVLVVWRVEGQTATSPGSEIVDGVSFHTEPCDGEGRQRTIRPAYMDATIHSGRLAWYTLILVNTGALHCPLDPAACLLHSRNHCLGHSDGNGSRCSDAQARSLQHTLTIYEILAEDIGCNAGAITIDNRSSRPLSGPV